MDWLSSINDWLSSHGGLFFVMIINLFMVYNVSKQVENLSKLVAHGFDRLSGTPNYDDE